MKSWFDIWKKGGYNIHGLNVVVFIEQSVDLEIITDETPKTWVDRLI